MSMYCMYTAKIFIIGQFFIIMIVLIVYESIFHYISAQTMESPLYTINLIVLSAISFVWFLIVVSQFKVASLTVILSAILLYCAIWIDLKDYDCDQHSNANLNVQGNILFLSHFYSTFVLYIVMHIGDTARLLQMVNLFGYILFESRIFPKDYCIVINDENCRGEDNSISTI